MDVAEPNTSEDKSIPMVRWFLLGGAIHVEEVKNYVLKGGISEASIEKAFVTLLRATRKDLEWAIETNRITIESAIGDAPVEELKEINDIVEENNNKE